MSEVHLELNSEESRFRVHKIKTQLSVLEMLRVGLNRARNDSHCGHFTIKSNSVAKIWPIRSRKIAN
jgi:hypothetical protein